MQAPAMNPASARNRRRARRRHARRLRLRVDYIQYAVVDVRNDVIETWIAATRANAGRLPEGLVADSVLATSVEKAITLPWRLIPSVPAHGSRRTTRAMNTEGAAALAKEIAENEQRARDMASLRGREDLLPALDRARQMLRVFADAPAPEFQGSLRRKPRY